MKDVARALGVHTSTVSLALRNDPRLRAETRRQIQDKAHSMGYRRDPLISTLMSHRALRRKQFHQMELAFLCHTPSKQEWLQLSEGYRRMWVGAREHARKNGYSLNIYCSMAPNLSPQRVCRILLSRNIRGIIIAPMPVSTIQMDLEWENFSVVELGYTLAHSRFHRVVHDYFHAMLLALTEARKRAYQRIGLVLRSHTDDKVHHLWRAAYVDEQSTRPHSEKVSPLIVPELESPILAKWIKRERPDLIFCIEVDLVRNALRKINEGYLNKIKIASLGCYTSHDETRGIYQSYEDMGKAAIDLLISMIHRGERGIPERSLSLAVNGAWIDGNGDRSI